MIKTCPICGKQFECNDLRRRYCSAECARRAKYNWNSAWNKENREDKHKDWAYREAEKLAHLLVDQDAMDELANYIYNNYNKRSK